MTLSQRARRDLVALTAISLAAVGCAGSGTGCSTLTPLAAPYAGTKTDNAINVQLSAIVDKPVTAGPTSVEARPGAPTRVLCASCHHGLPIPAPLGEVISEAEKTGGVNAGLAKFKELRAKFYGGQQYDFTDYALVGIANTALNAKRPDDAMRYLQANLEYFPKSSQTYQMMAQVKNAKGDKPGAIKDLETAVQLDPQNNQAKNQLQQLKQ